MSKKKIYFSNRSSFSRRYFV